MSAFNNESCAVSSMISNKLLKFTFSYTPQWCLRIRRSRQGDTWRCKTSDSIVSLQVADATVDVRQDTRSLVRVLSRYHHPNVRAFTGLERLMSLCNEQRLKRFTFTITGNTVQANRLHFQSLNKQWKWVDDQTCLGSHSLTLRLIVMIFFLAKGISSGLSPWNNMIS